MLDGSRFGEERFELRERMRAQGLARVEVLRGQSRQRLRTLRTRPKPHVTLRPVLHDDLAVGRREASCERCQSAPLPLETPEHELNVLAGTQRVGREVRAGAILCLRP